MRHIIKDSHPYKSVDTDVKHYKNFSINKNREIVEKLNEYYGFNLNKNKFLI